MRQASWLFARVAFVSGILIQGAIAQSVSPPPGSGNQHWNMRFLHRAETSRIADPKLAGGGVNVAYVLDASGMTYDVKITALAAGQPIATVFDGQEKGSTRVKHHLWDGKDANGKWVDPGSYTIKVEATTTRTLKVEYTVDVVRLGITGISAESSSGTNEWQVVYFRKDGAYRYFASPATGEWVSIAKKGDLADLDLNDGSPRPAPPVHTQTDEPVLDPNLSGGFHISTDYYDYPLCYQVGARPQFTVTFGATCIDSTGAPIGCNYPVAGYELRCVAKDEAGPWFVKSTGSNTPGGTETLVGPLLTTDITRTDRHVEWHWQYCATGASDWFDVPGTFTTEHWIYTQLRAPYWAPGATGMQYTGPWEEILDYMYSWQQSFGITPTDDASVVELLIKGFNGQPTLSNAIEGVEYDCPGVGGDGGATHYFDGTNVRLSHLLNAHDDGIYVNCTDCASNTSVILGMLGIQNVQMERLGSMVLRAIWGIGTPDYTLDLWNNGGGSGHGFSYHHIITRDAGVDISDACLWVDDDGDPNHLPGTPGYNHDRLWDDYEKLLAHGNVQWNLDILPKIR
jgi:hypothetical protein